VNRSYMKGIHFVRDIVERSLESVRAPSLVPSHILLDLKTIRDFFNSESLKWTTKDALVLFPVHLLLRGCEVGECLRNRPVRWPIQLAETVGEELQGLALLLVENNDVAIYQRELKNRDYAFVVGCSWNEALPELPNRMEYIKKRDLVDSFMAVAVACYMDTFAQTIRAVPGANEALLNAVQQVLRLDWKMVSQIYQRWLSLTRNE
jgi:hypothetical protein